MAELLNLRIGASICSKYSANKISKSRILFTVLFLFCVFFFGNAKVYSFPIWNQADWNNFVSIASGPTGGAGQSFALMVDVGTPGSPIAVVTQPISGTFRGHFNGNNRRVIVNITENTPNVGLFSELRGLLTNLIVDGSVTGGPNSRNVGGLVGLVESGGLHFVTNLADVTGLAFNSSVGGIAGAITSNIGVGCTDLSNNGTITGGQYVAGVVGSIDSPVGATNMRYIKNSGNILRVINAEQVFSTHITYVAGIVAYVSSNCIHIDFHDFTNIGKVVGANSDFSGGLIAYFATGRLYSGANSGIVVGGNIAVGGVASYLGHNAYAISCINTNWIEPTVTGLNSGAIVGENNGIVDSCYYDNQMCILEGIGSGTGGQAIGLPTISMLGNSLDGFLSSCIYSWVFQDSLYPRPVDYGNQISTHPINLLSAAPIYLDANDSLHNVQTPFTVSNNLWLSVGVGNPYPFDYPYQWGSFVNLPAGGWIHIPNSVMGYISVPAPPSIIANIVGIGQDSLVVRLPQWYYQTLYPLNYNVIFEKVVPIWVR